MRMRRVICSLPHSKIRIPHYLINDTIFEKKEKKKKEKKKRHNEQKCVFWFSLQISSEIFFILRINERDMIQIV
jgi:hypothetical protein